ncbi:uncharacterized protein ACLA_002370 [Aspergillus clavatus NRRL 1]|uniref:Uncharacterized protein n=1 Tax=Aspergillus clavatus (strain ATCC 1007 / CBS 513.65 / DSM 816 / NCTC 3887 / NRRL 1 / QM 1276 / 107) TaxID=344612 RepID=A1C558_ASPCL|nr:uncharacterized protein ACLA_002370 [Aspergillus clavatus NRRL 1]EAW14826.1 hypothetical protein ACLA_002370 [Aspergillus clavatus NRRL 1]
MYVIDPANPVSQLSTRGHHSTCGPLNNGVAEWDVAEPYDVDPMVFEQWSPLDISQYPSLKRYTVTKVWLPVAKR